MEKFSNIDQILSYKTNFTELKIKEIIQSIFLDLLELNYKSIAESYLKIFKYLKIKPFIFNNA